MFINHKGRHKARCIGDSKRAAEEIKRKLEAKLALGEFAVHDPHPTPTFAQYAEDWLATCPVDHQWDCVVHQYFTKGHGVQQSCERPWSTGGPNEGKKWPKTQLDTTHLVV